MDTDDAVVEAVDEAVDVEDDEPVDEVAVEAMEAELEAMSAPWSILQRTSLALAGTVSSHVVPSRQHAWVVPF